MEDVTLSTRQIGIDCAPGSGLDRGWTGCGNVFNSFCTVILDCDGSVGDMLVVCMRCWISIYSCVVVFWCGGTVGLVSVLQQVAQLSCVDAIVFAWISDG